jgi:transposase-like protein
MATRSPSIPLPPRERPRYPPVERLAILRHCAAYGLSAAECARIFLITPATHKNWIRRRDEQGDDALVQIPEPVNRYPDFVASIVQALKATLPSMGRKRIAFGALQSAEVRHALPPPSSQRRDQR